MPSTLSRSYSVPVSFVPQPTRSKDASIVSLFSSRETTPGIRLHDLDVEFADFFSPTTTLLGKTLCLFKDFMINSMIYLFFNSLDKHESSN